MALSNRHNAFGFLRLFFASAVIVSHAFVIVDGTADREPLRRLFPATDLGTLAVLGFFIVSGYLITGSIETSRSYLAYVAKRVCRIYPGFLVAFWSSILVFAPMGGGWLPADISVVGKRLVDSAALQFPMVDGAFDKTHVAALNGSMWTISYEFRCYLLLLVLDIIGVLQRRRLVAALVTVGLMGTMMFRLPVSEVPPNIWGSNLLMYAFGAPPQDIRLITAFLGGAAFYLYRKDIVFRKLPIVGALVFLLAALALPGTAIAGSIIFGGYLIFAFAFEADWACGVNNRNDVSYGVYLYARPIMKLINLWHPEFSPWLVAGATFVLSVACGWLSCTIVERPVLGWARGRQKDSGMIYRLVDRRDTAPSSLPA